MRGTVLRLAALCCWLALVKAEGDKGEMGTLPSYSYTDMKHPTQDRENYIDSEPNLIDYQKANFDYLYKNADWPDRIHSEASMKLRKQGHYREDSRYSSSPLMLHSQDEHLLKMSGVLQFFVTSLLTTMSESNPALRDVVKDDVEMFLSAINSLDESDLTINSIREIDVDPHIKPKRKWSFDSSENSLGLNPVMTEKFLKNLHNMSTAEKGKMAHVARGYKKLVEEASGGHRLKVLEDHVNGYRPIIINKIAALYIYLLNNNLTHSYNNATSKEAFFIMVLQDLSILWKYYRITDSASNEVKLNINMGEIFHNIKSILKEKLFEEPTYYLQTKSDNDEFKAAVLNNLNTDNVKHHIVRFDRADLMETLIKKLIDVLEKVFSVFIKDLENSLSKYNKNYAGREGNEFEVKQHPAKKVQEWLKSLFPSLNINRGNLGETILSRRKREAIEGRSLEEIKLWKDELMFKLFGVKVKKTPSKAESTETVPPLPSNLALLNAQGGYHWVSLDQLGYTKPGFVKSGYDKALYGKTGYEKALNEKAGYDQAGYDQAGYGKAGYEKALNEKAGYGTFPHNQESITYFDRILDRFVCKFVTFGVGIHLDSRTSLN